MFKHFLLSSTSLPALAASMPRMTAEQHQRFADRMEVVSLGLFGNGKRRK